MQKNENAFMKASQNGHVEIVEIFLKIPNIDINEKNTAENAWQKKSEGFDFSKEDRIPDRAFTEVIWKAVKGADAIVPAPKRAAFVKQSEKEDD